MTDDDIKELCKACSNLLHTLDATHSTFLKWCMKWDDEAKKAVRELEALIASALKQARAIGVLAQRPSGTYSKITSWTNTFG